MTHGKYSNKKMEGLSFPVHLLVIDALQCFFVSYGFHKSNRNLNPLHMLLGNDLAMVGLKHFRTMEHMVLQKEGYLV